MRILDRYLFRTFLTPWLGCLAGFTFLFVLIDLVETLSDFVDAGVGPVRMASYYLRFLPSVWMYVGPITLLLGLLYALYQLTRNNEVIAMRASGISLYRVLLPFIFFGSAVSLFSMHIAATVAPRTLAWTEGFFVREASSNAELLTQLRFRNPESNRTWDIAVFDPAQQMIRDITIYQRWPGRDTLQYVLRAEKAVWIDSYWYFHNVDLQEHSEEGYQSGPLKQYSILPRDDITESPEQIARNTKDFNLMTSREIRMYMKDRPSLSEKTAASLRTHLQMRRAHPWLCLVTMLMAVPFGRQTARKGVFRGVAMCILLFFTLYFTMNLFKALGLGLHVPPWIAGWTPTLFFGALGLYFLRRLR